MIIGKANEIKDLLVGGRTDGGTRLIFRNAATFDAATGFGVADVVVDGGIVTALLPTGSAVPASDTTVVDAAGATLLPGFIDAHAHPLIAGQERFGLSVRSCRDVTEVQAAVEAHARRHPQLPFISGEGFELSIAPDGAFFAAALDAVVPDRPVALRSNDIHTYWCNSRALELAGVSAETPDPVDGIIERHPDGTPTGTLREWGAFAPVRAAMPPATDAERAAQLRAGLFDLARVGVTSVLDAWVDGSDVPAYLLAARAGLPVKLDLALRAEPGRWRSQVAEFAGLRDRLAAETTAGRLSATTVKFFADGIIEGGTAAVHDPYAGSHSCGLRSWEPEALRAAVRGFDDAGFDVHIHAIGDAAVSTALTAIEALPPAGPGRVRRPAIAHAQLVAQPDRRRFAATGTTAVMQPYWAKLDDIVEQLTIGRLDRGRAELQYPTASLLAAGVNVAFSSDYPISTGNPLCGIAVAMTRAEDGDPGKAWLPHELLTRHQALAAYTTGAAHVTRTAHGGGRLRVGAAADLVLIGGDLETASPADLMATEVIGVWVDGIPVPPASTEETEG